MLLPVAAGIRMAVQTKNERAHWINIQWLGSVSTSKPTCWPSVAWKGDPSLSASKKRLAVGLFRVRLFAGNAREQAVEVARIAGFHCCRAATKLLEDRSLPVLIANVVPLEDVPALAFSVLVANRKLAAFFDSNSEDLAEVHGLSCASGAGFSDMHLLNQVLVPTAGFRKLRVFLKA